MGYNGLLQRPSFCCRRKVKLSLDRALQYVSCSSCVREGKKTFHSILQEFPEVGSFRTIHRETATAPEGERCNHKSVQEPHSKSMVSLHVDVRPAQKIGESGERI